MALISFGFWGWKLTASSWRYVFVLLVPLIFAIAWGIFNVPEDPSRSGNAPIIVSGLIRLISELVFFALASVALYHLGYQNLWWIFGALIILHYLISYDRIIWLIAR